MGTSDNMASDLPSLSAPASDSAAPAHDDPSSASSSNYGGVNPEVEDNLLILNYVSDEGLRSDATDHRKTIASCQNDYYPLSVDFNIAATTDEPPSPAIGNSRLLSLPSELIDAILAYLSPCDLAVASETCRCLYAHASSDIHWFQRVQANVPGTKLETPYPHRTYRELYAAHDPRWFLPKYKIWFCDRDLMGKVIIVRYDQRRGCIEGYQLLAISTRTAYQLWPADTNVMIHAFEPRVKLHLDKPVLQFDAHAREDISASSSWGARGSRFAAEVPMSIDGGADGMFSNFLMARPLDTVTSTGRMEAPFPYGNVWPPPAMPARHRVAGVASGLDADDLSPADTPTRRAEASDQAFRIRHWMEMAGSPAPGLFLGAGPVRLIQAMRANMMGGRGIPGVHIGEEVVTYSTLDPVVYTPTPLKPWRGIWVGDYSGHGCEFLLINQPDDDEEVSDEQLGLVRGAGESDDEWMRRRTQATVHRGRLEAIKLTGDPNVPRGEYTFVADDLGEAGFIGIAQEAPFQGTRVVRSRGHVAGTGFLEDKYIESQLMLVSHDRLAQYWVNFGHISYFERVNIDEFLTP